MLRKGKKGNDGRSDFPVSERLPFHPINFRDSFSKGGGKSKAVTRKICEMYNGMKGGNAKLEIGTGERVSQREEGSISEKGENGGVYICITQVPTGHPLHTSHLLYIRAEVQSRKSQLTAHEGDLSFFSFFSRTRFCITFDFSFFYYFPFIIIYKSLRFDRQEYFGYFDRQHIG